MSRVLPKRAKWSKKRLWKSILKNGLYLFFHLSIHGRQFHNCHNLMKGCVIYASDSNKAVKATQPIHSLKIARLMAHPWKKLKLSVDILTFIAIPNEFWKGKGFVWSSGCHLSHKFGPSKLWHNFLVFLYICKVWGYFCQQIVLNQVIKHSNS